ncbi:hypothetical protein BDZ94DRAFT_1268378 [Collybia nuda]|uniref:Uncharacterized protein n=1 Tax=Collybia nuda TaxID=64659 RepID=A0A9P6CFY3_9AGAR|nr:hypothetical protein BDZ94DRAFT_1268378 [Collybia nuda]
MLSGAGKTRAPSCLLDQGHLVWKASPLAISGAVLILLFLEGYASNRSLKAQTAIWTTYDRHFVVVDTHEMSYS